MVQTGKRVPLLTQKELMPNQIVLTINRKINQGEYKRKEKSTYFKVRMLLPGIVFITFLNIIKHI